MLLNRKTKMTEPCWFLKISKNWGKNHSEKGRLHEIVRLTRLGQLASTVMSVLSLSRDVGGLAGPVQALELGRCF